MVLVCGEKTFRSCSPTYIPTPSMVPLDDGAEGSPKNAATSESRPAPLALALARATGTTDAAALSTGTAPAGGTSLSAAAGAAMRLAGRADVALTLAAAPTRRLLELAAGPDPPARTDVVAAGPELLTLPGDEEEPASSAAASPGVAAIAAAMPAVTAPMRSH